MSLFPSVWDMLLPNWSWTTGLGVAFIVLAVVIFVFLDKLRWIGINTSKVSGIMAIIGIILIWGVSMVSDFVTSKGGALITVGIFVVAMLGFVLFWEPKKVKRKK